MIGAKPKAPATLADAIAAIDFSAGNAALERLRAEAANVAAKDTETRQEVLRLANEVRDFAGPEPDAIAAAILAGKPLAEATQGATSRDQLEAQRDALTAALGSLEQRAAAIRTEIADLEGRERSRAYDALAGYIAELDARQKRAAQEIVEIFAALSAIADATGRSYEPVLRGNRAATKSILGGDGLLGWQAELSVPADVREALNLLSSKSSAVRSSPTAIATRYL